MNLLILFMNKLICLIINCFILCFNLEGNLEHEDVTFLKLKVFIISLKE